MNKETATCCIDGCSRAISDPYIMCGPHWTMLDWEFRRSLIAAIKRAKRKNAAVAQTRIDEAVAQVARAEGRTAFDDGLPRQRVAGGYRVGTPSDRDER